MIVGADYENAMDGVLNFKGAEIKSDVFGTENACVDIYDALNKHFEI